MRKLFLSFLAVFSMTFVPAFAQHYEPKDSWPYENEKFIDGVVRTRSGALITTAKLNVCILDGALHYVDESEIIMKGDMSSIFAAKIGEDVYYNAQGRMMKVLSETKEGSVLKAVLLNTEKMSQSEIGYGVKSSTASTQNVYLINEMMNTLINTEYNAALDKRSKGEVIPTIERTYVFACGYLVPATRDGLLSVGLDRKAVTDYLKHNKIKTKDISSLESMLSFVYSQLKK